MSVLCWFLIVVENLINARSERYSHLVFLCKALPNNFKKKIHSTEVFSMEKYPPRGMVCLLQKKVYFQHRYCVYIFLRLFYNDIYWWNKLVFYKNLSYTQDVIIIVRYTKRNANFGEYYQPHRIFLFQKFTFKNVLFALSYRVHNTTQNVLRP